MADQKELKKDKQVRVEPVFGPMVHIVLNKQIDGETKFDEIDFWLQAQIDAGKLRLVD